MGSAFRIRFIRRDDHVVLDIFMDLPFRDGSAFSVRCVAHGFGLSVFACQ